MDTGLPALYRIYTPEYDSRLKPRKVPWRKGAPPVVTDERRASVANLEQATKAVEKEQRELEIGRRRMDLGRMVRSVIDKQQWPGDTLTQIGTQLALHNAPRPDPASSWSHLRRHNREEAGEVLSPGDETRRLVPPLRLLRLRLRLRLRLPTLPLPLAFPLQTSRPRIRQRVHRREP